MDRRYFETELKRLCERDRECKSLEEWEIQEQEVRSLALNPETPSDIKSFASFSLWEHSGMMVETLRILKEQGDRTND